MRENYKNIGKRGLSRRSLIKTSSLAGVGLTTAALVGCGDDDDAETTPSAPTTAGSTPGSTEPTATPASAVSKGGKLTVVVPEPADLNPHTGIGGNEHQTLWLLHDNLIAYDETSVPTPELSLATEWEIVSPTEIVLKLRENVQFHDGEPLTAEVVKYNLELIQDPATASVSQGQIAPIASIDTPDELTVVLNLAHPSASLLLALGDRGGMVVSRATLEAKGLADYAASPTGGSGAFTFDNWTRNGNLTLKANADYWRTRDGESIPHLADLELKFISESAVILAALQSGEAHVAPVAPEDLPVIEQDDNLRLSEFVGTSTSQLFMNRTSPIFSDPRVRQAMTHVFNREDLINAITDGRSQTALGPLTPAQWAFDPDLPHPTHDPQKARELFDAAGVVDGTVIKAITYAGREPERRQVELLQNWLSEFGITLETEFLQSGAAFALYKEGNHDCFFSGFSIRADPHGSLGEQFLSQGGFAWTQNPQTGDLDEDVDRLLRQANEEYDIEARKGLYSEAQDLIVNDSAMTAFLYYNNVNLGVSNLADSTGPLFGGEGKPRYAELYRKS